MPPIKIRRGTDAQLPTLPLGTPGWTTDSKKLYIGNGVGNTLINPDNLSAIENGFVDRADSVLSFEDRNRELTISPTGASYDFYANDTKYTKTSSETVVISSSTGLHFIYFNSYGVLTATTVWDADILIREGAIVCIVNWNDTQATGILVTDERHGRMNSETHAYLHEVFHAQWVSGLDLGDIITNGSGDLDTHAQISVANGVFRDEDIRHTITDGSPQTLSAPAAIPGFYRSGASGEWYQIAATNFPCQKGTNYLYWNEYTGATWQRTEATNNDFVLTHIFATGDINNPIIWIMGQAEYDNRSAAETGALNELKEILFGNLAALVPEMLPIATLIFQTGSTKSNAVAASIEETDDGSDYIDWRFNSTATGGVSGSATSWGEVVGTLADQIDLQNALDAKLSSVVAGTHCTIDNTDTQNPVINVSAGADGADGADGAPGGSVDYAKFSKDAAIETMGFGVANKVAVEWDDEVAKPTLYTHSNTVTPERITVGGDGIYFVDINIRWTTPVTSTRVTVMASIWLNGVELPETRMHCYHRGKSYHANIPSVPISTMLSLSTSDYLEVFIWIEDSDISTYAETTDLESEFVISRISAAAATSGIQGETGLAGADGQDGVDGLGWTGGSYNGTNGIVTFTSDDGLGFSTGDLRGADGADGADGAQGPQGIQGIQGIQGDTGATGDTGPQGDQGIQGIQGIQGETGPAGADGADGADGDFTLPVSLQGSSFTAVANTYHYISNNISSSPICTVPASPTAGDTVICTHLSPNYHMNFRSTVHKVNGVAAGNDWEIDGTCTVCLIFIDATTGWVSYWVGRTITDDLIAKITGPTGSFELPAGTTAMRDTSPDVGFLRWNSTDDNVEVYNGTDWEAVGGSGGLTLTRLDPNTGPYVGDDTIDWSASYDLSDFDFVYVEANVNYRDNISSVASRLVRTSEAISNGAVFIEYSAKVGATARYNRPVVEDITTDGCTIGIADDGTGWDGDCSVIGVWGVS